MKENNTISNDNKNNENNNKLMSISSNTEFTKKNSCGTNNPNAISITNINPQLENNNTNIYNARFQLLNGVLSAAQTKIMNNINYVLGTTNCNNKTTIPNTTLNSNTNINVSNNNINITNNISIQNEKLMANLSYINFNLVKILYLTIININRINLFWDIIIETTNLLCSNSINNRFSNTLSKLL